uniref:Fork-head domain-containing protein n=1 Tax=Anopheles farauti TaxID=69004 RepID=A0A182QLG9_9DIPT
MTQLEDDELLNNLLKLPGTIIIYNNDMSSYDYVLNAHNVTLPLTPATSTAASEQSVDDLNSSASIDADLTESPVPGPVEFQCPAGQAQLPPGPFPPATDGRLEGVGGSCADDTVLEDMDEEEQEPAEEEEEEEIEFEELETGGPGADAPDEDDSEPELTNLSWLTELKNITNLTPSDVPLTDLPTARFNKFIAQVRRSRETYDKRKEQYTSPASAQEKPPFNYAQIIAMAMLEEGRMTLKQICKWIQEKFSYYKVHKNWNNSIRHNLSLSFFFTKVQRAKDEKGKGGYWELSMDVSKSERRRVRVRQRNKSATSAASRRATAVPAPAKGSPGSANNNNNNNEQTVNHNLPTVQLTAIASHVENEAILGEEPHGSTMLTTLDTNNNCSLQQQQQPPPPPQQHCPTEPLQVQNVMIDIIDNYSKRALDNTTTSTVLPMAQSELQPAAALQPAPHPLPVNDEQLLRASSMVEGCAINFDSIMNGDGGANIFSNLNEIFSDNEIPQPANDDIIVPFFSNVQQVQAGPNVVVETIPYYLPDMGNFDESDFGNLININEQEISDEFLTEHGFL